MQITQSTFLMATLRKYILALAWCRTTWGAANYSTVKFENNSIRLSASDLSNHLNCGHVTTLDYSVAMRQIPRPDWTDPDTAVLQELGRRHERRYLETLAARSLVPVDLRHATLDSRGMAETASAMKRGEAVIVQAPLCEGRWVGRADLLIRVETPSRLGSWCYEVYDCKLARETKAATILQLSLYSDLIAGLQRLTPKFMYVVSPSETLTPEPFSVLEYAAYYRLVKSRLEQTVNDKPTLTATAAEPNLHCDVCAWWKRCDSQWRKEDHLSLVAGITRLQRKQLVGWDIASMARLAQMPLPLGQRPDYGSKQGYERVANQARVQIASRETSRVVHETFQIEGLARLHEPTLGDVFFDLEGDYFVGNGGIEYLFGLARFNREGKPTYECRWALNPAEEKAAFEWFVDTVMESWSAHPGMHVYHFTAREPSALKRLMGKYVTREDAVDRMLRGRVMVDLHTVLKQSIRAGVEEYSLKNLESLYTFARGTPLEAARPARRLVEHGLELGMLDHIDDATRRTIEGYNADDCMSTAALRSWLEERRSQAIAGGEQIPRPEPLPSEPSAALDERQKALAAVFDDLTKDVPVDPKERTAEQSASWLLANLLDWHRREEKTKRWEFFHMKELPDEELIYERSALAGLQYVERIAFERAIPTDRYSFPAQESDIRSGDTLYQHGEKIGEATKVDIPARTVDIKKMKKTASRHPVNVYAFDDIPAGQAAKTLLRLAAWILENGVDSSGAYRCARDLLLGSFPRLATPVDGPLALDGEAPLDAARRILPQLDSGVLAIQGPPGSGKTYAAASMICDLVRANKRVGITGPSHKVIRNLLDQVLILAAQQGLQNLACLQKVKEKSGSAGPIAEVTDNEKPLQALLDGSCNVAAGTTWMWSREEFAESVDVLFVDEAGQMSLANVLASAHAGRNLILLGDPQQLEQPLQGSHPDGAAVSALEHVLGEARTIAPDRGLFLEKTRRLHPEICEFTSELFYDGRLHALSGLDQQRIENHPYLSHSGLRFIAVDHEGNQNASVEETNVIEALVNQLLRSGTTWFDVKRTPAALCPLTPKDILIIAPYNAQVSDIAQRLPGIEVGTVDRFQGREAAIVIYSLTTSSPEDAPRGMEFLYSLNRLNVATSRGRAMCIVVGSPRLLEPQCRTPRQMQLANALCRFAELAGRIRVIDNRDGRYDFVVIPAA